MLVENELNELSEKVKALSTKGDLINKHSNLNSANCFSGILQNCFIFISVKNYIKYFSGTTRIYLWIPNGKNTKIYQFKANDSEVNHHTLCLGNISKKLTISYLKKKKQD